MTTPPVRRALGALVAAVLLLAVIGPAGAAPNQYARSIGFAAGNPLSGSVATAPIVVTSAPCPSGTTAINGFVDSDAAGLVTASAIAANTTDIGAVNTTGISFSFNLLDVAAGQGKTLVNGRYELSVVCLPDLFGSPGLGQFDATFTVSGGATATSPGTTYTFDPGGNVTGTSTALTADPASQGKLGGTGITLTATVSPAAPGTVQFVDVPAGGAATNLGPAISVDATTGRATVALGSLTPPPPEGTRVLRAVFTPTDAAKFSGSTSPDVAYQIVGANQTQTTTTLTASPAVSVVKGNPLSLAATVATLPAGGAAPVGTVRFFDAGVQLGEAAVADGVAVLALRPGTAATLALRATFVPTDPSVAGSTSTPDLTYLVSEPFTEGPFLGLLTVRSPDTANPGKGTVTDRVSLVAPRGCPSGSSAMTMRITGPGAWAAGFPVASDGVYAKAGDTVPTGQDIASVAGLNSVEVVPGLYFIAATCRVSAFDPTATGFFVGQLWFYDSTSWLNQDPAVVGIPTVTALQVLPAGRSVLASKVVLTVTISPADAAGEIEFDASSTGGDTTLGTVKLAKGKASLTVSKLALGLYYLTAAYKPATKTHNASTSPEVVHAVTKAVPPTVVTGASIGGRPRVGSRLTCRSSFRNASGSTYLWLRDGVAVSGRTARTYTPTTADAGRRLQCRALATNAGGTVYRDSPAVKVGR